MTSAKIEAAITDKMYQEYAEGTPISTLSKRYGITEAKLRKRLKEYR